MQRRKQSIVRLLGLALAVGLALGSAARPQDAEQQGVVPPGPTPLHRAVWLARVRPYTPEGQAIQAARAAHVDPRAEFDAALAEIGRGPTSLSADLEGDPIAHRIVEIAAERRRAPAGFALVFGERIHVRDQSRGQRAPPLTGALLDPALRLVWEDLLLGPRPFGAANEIEERALTALAKIGDPRSLAVLEHRFRMTARAGAEAKAVATEQQRLLEALWRFPSAAGIATLLRFLDAALPAEGSSASTPMPSGLDVRARALDLFSGAERGAISEDWKTALLSFEAGPETRPSVVSFLAELKARAASMPVIGK